MSSRSVSDPELCQDALQQVLKSHAFARSEQAKSFLRYVCETTIAGHAGDIKEYSIGVQALGRPANYSPSDDSSVRRRAYEIRQRLEEFYSTEMPQAKIRIELPKGSYVPVFVEHEPSVAEQHTEDKPAPPAEASWTEKWKTTLVLAAGAIIGAGLFWGMRTIMPGTSLVAPAVREFWGPLLEPGSRTLICVGGTLHMTLRAAPFPEDPNLPSFPAPKEVYRMYAETRPLPPDANIFMRPVDSVASIGVISGVAVATNTMRLAGASYQILPERQAPLASFRGRNVILFGDALTSQAAAKELARAYLQVAYDDSGMRLVIRDRRKPSPPRFERKQESSSAPLEAYGLITVLPTENSGASDERMFVISGVSNAGIHGAMEFLASPDRLRDLEARFARQGLKALPDTYQVVVKCTAASTLLLSYEYAAHEVIDPKVAAALE